MIKLLKIMAFGVTGLIAILLVLPFFISLQDYKPEIESKITQALGRPVTIDTLSLRLLPAPSIAIQALKVANLPGGTNPYVATVDTLKARINVLALLKKHVRFTYVTFTKPKIFLETVKDRPNWSFTPSESLQKPEDVQKNESSDSSVSFAIDHVDVLAGSMTYLQGNKPIEIKDITATIHMDSLQGPIKSFGYIKAFDSDIRFDIAIKEFADEIPLKITLDTVGIETTLDGRFSLDQKIFKGDVSFQAQSDLIAQVSKKSAYLKDFVKESLTGKAYVTVSTDSLNIKNLELELDDQKLTGLASIVFSPLKMDLDLRGLPGGTALLLSAAPLGSQMRGKMSLDSSNPKKLLMWMNIPVDKINDDFATKMTISSDFLYENPLIHLKNLALMYRQSTFTGDLRYDMQKNQAVYEVSLNNISSLLKVLGLDLTADPGRLYVQGESSLKNGVQTHTNFKLNGLEAHVQGSLIPKVDASFALSTKDATPLFRSFSDAPAPFKGFDIGTHIKGTLETLTFNDLKAKINMGPQTLPFEGALALALKGKPSLTGNLSLSTIQADRLLSADAILEPQIMLAAYKKQPIPAVKPTLSPAERWGKASFTFSGLKALNMNVGISIDHILYKDWAVDAFTGKLKISEGVFYLDEGKGRCFDGTFQLEGALMSGKPAALKVIGSLKGAQLKRFSPKDQGAIKVTDGKLDALVNVSTKGTNIYEWVHSLKGRVSFQGQKGVIQGFDLKKINEKLKNLKNITGMIDFISTSLSHGQTHFDSFEGDIEWTNGVGTITKGQLKADGGEGRAMGKIDLPAYTMDVLGTFTLEDLPDFPPIQMRLVGPLDDPKKIFITKALEDYVMKNVFKTLLDQTNLDKSVGGALGDLLGMAKKGTSNDEASIPAPDSSKPAPKSTDAAKPSVKDVIKNPEKAIENVLKGLF